MVGGWSNKGEEGNEGEQEQGAMLSDNTHDHNHCRPTNHCHQQLLTGKWGATGRGGDGNNDREGETRGGRNQEGHFNTQWPT
jgi:hypothetical protein